jgi:hypothetical protein
MRIRLYERPHIVTADHFRGYRNRITYGDLFAKTHDRPRCTGKYGSRSKLYRALLGIKKRGI